AGAEQPIMKRPRVPSRREDRAMGLRRTVLATCLVFALAAGRAAAGERTDFPKAARDRFDQAQELRKQGKFREGIDAYADAIRLGMEEYPRAHLNRAGSYLDLKDYDAAIAQYKKFIERFGLEGSCRL